MAVETSIPKSPGWWFVRLTRRLINEQRPQVDLLQRYLLGDHPLPDTLESDTGRDFLKKARSNYVSLVVEAVIERMKATGFRTADTEGDAAALNIWQRARLDADQSLVYRSMIGLSRAYVMVGQHPRKRGQALVTIEDPHFVTTESYQDDRREVEAGLKIYSDAFGYARAVVYMPNRIVRFRSLTPAPTSAGLASASSFYAESGLRTWEVVEDVVNPLGVVPIVPFLNRPGIDGTPRGEFEDVIDVQDRINQTLLVRLTAEKFGAWRQRALLNMALEEDEEGNAVAPDLPSHPAFVWTLQGEGLQIWESQQTSTSDMLAGVHDDIRDLAAITRTPPHYLLSGIVNASGDALSAAETGLVSKVRERLAQAGESWEQVLRLAFLVLGDRAHADEDSPLEVIWADPESRSLSEVSDAVVKQMAAGVPWRARMELLGYTPPEIDRMEQQRTQDAMLAMLAAPPQPVAIGAVPTVPVPPGAAVVDAEALEDDGSTG